MRYNEEELTKIGEGNALLEGVLQHMKPQENDWSDWYQQPQFKPRYFKLMSNLLFYYRMSSTEPVGVLVLENSQVAYENPRRGIPFAFSITFKVNDTFKDNESKHIFSCKCDADVSKWVSALKISSYEYWRSQYVILKTKISMKTGKDPVLDYLKSKHCINSVTSSSSEKSIEKNKNSTKVKECKKASFYSHIETSSFSETKSFMSNNIVTKLSNLEVGNLIEL